jgi:hypothetical protein
MWRDDQGPRLSSPLPKFIVEWCDLAAKEMHIIARARSGSAMPPTFSIPGFTDRT